MKGVWESKGARLGRGAEAGREQTVKWVRGRGAAKRKKGVRCGTSKTPATADQPPKENEPNMRACYACWTDARNARRTSNEDCDLHDIETRRSFLRNSQKSTCESVENFVISSRST